MDARMTPIRVPIVGLIRRHIVGPAILFLTLSNLATAQPDPPSRRDDRPGPDARREHPFPPGDERDRRPPPPFGGERDGPPDAFRPRPLPWPEWPEAERQDVERFVEENFPRVFVELSALKEQNDRRYNFRMSRMAPQMKRIMETMKVDPPRAATMIRERQVEMDIYLAAHEYRSAEDESAKQRLKAKLTELAGQAFDFRHQRREEEIRDLESRLELLKSRLSETQAMRAELIRRHVEDILSRPPPPMDEGDRPPPRPEDEP